MAKNPTPPRAPAQDPDPDDRFLALVAQVSIWAAAHTRTLLVGGVVLLMLILAAVYYVDSQRRVEAEAATRFTQVQQSVMVGNVPLAIRDLQTFIATFGGTAPAREARVLLADLYLAEDRPREAIEALGRLPRDLDGPTGVAAAQLLAAAHEAIGEADEAMDVYRGLARNARFQYQRREALADAARVALQAGRADEAVRFFDELVDTFEPEDPSRGYFEMWRAEARARADRGPAATPVAVPETGDPEGAEPEAGAPEAGAPEGGG